MSGGWVTPVRLTVEQRAMIVAEMTGMQRSPMLRDSIVQERILLRIEGALTRLGARYSGPEPANSFERLRQFSDGKIHSEKLKPEERALMDLAATRGGRTSDEMRRHAAYAAESLRLGRGEKYGDKKENQTRFLADQLAELLVIHLGLRAGHGDKSSFRALMDVTCDQVGLPVLSRDAIQSITRKYSKPSCLG